MTASIAPIARDNLTTRVYEELRNAMMEGRFWPGHRFKIRELAAEAHKLNETCRIYVNLMAANVRRRLQILSGQQAPAYKAGGYALG